MDKDCSWFLNHQDRNRLQKIRRPNGRPKTGETNKLMVATFAVWRTILKNSMLRSYSDVLRGENLEMIQRRDTRIGWNPINCCPRFPFEVKSASRPESEIEKTVKQ